MHICGFIAVPEAVLKNLEPMHVTLQNDSLISNQLVLVGAKDSKVLGVWGADRKAWTHPYRNAHCTSRIVLRLLTNRWLVVAGGRAQGERVSCVELIGVHVQFLSPSSHSGARINGCLTPWLGWCSLA